MQISHVSPKVALRHVQISSVSPLVDLRNKLGVGGQTLNEPNHRSVRMKQRSIACVSILFLVLTITGCATGDAPTAGSGQGASRTVTTAGSSSPAQARSTLTPTRRAPRKTPTPTVRPTRRATATPKAQSGSGLATVRYQDLPRQAQDTIRLIDKGGPFPFDRDGITFQNREGILPKKPNGYYHEYTVITPGSSDRGARRIIAGDLGELYYTDDHYDSFREVIR